MIFYFSSRCFQFKDLITFETSFTLKSFDKQRQINQSQFRGTEERLMVKIKLQYLHFTFIYRRESKALQTISLIGWCEVRQFNFHIKKPLSQCLYAYERYKPQFQIEYEFTVIC